MRKSKKIKLYFGSMSFKIFISIIAVGFIPLFLVTGTIMAHVDTEIWQEIYILLMALAVSIIAVAVIVSLTLTKPFRKLDNTIDAMYDGYMPDEITLGGYSETKIITDSFSKMLEKMNQLERSRQEFVSNVSHELKTPITGIKVLADSLLAQEDAPSELYREFLTDIVVEIERENKIITDLLSLVKLDKTRGDMNIEFVNINDLLEVILKRLRPLALKKNIELVLESYRTVVAEVDEIKLSLAISNFVDNAIKYNKIDGWVRVSLNADHKYFYVKIEDSGIGVPKDMQDKIFERFYRVDKARSRESGGTGLGLAIAQSAILLHNGVIKVYSKENEGTTFNIKIPLAYMRK